MITRFLKSKNLRKSLLLIMGSAAFISFSSCNLKNKKSPPIGDFQVTSPIVADTTVTEDYVADIQAVQNVELRSRVKGYLDKINVDEGKFVKQGQVLFILSNQEYKEALAKASAELKSAIADVKTSELELQNVKILVDKNVVSKTELELAQAKLDASLAKVEEATATESGAKLDLSYTLVKAPFDGVINRIPNKIGSLIDEGMLLTTISNINDVYAYFHVSEEEYLGYVKDNELHNQKEVALVLADNEMYPLKGVIETVEGEIEKSTGNIAFRAKFPNPDLLLKHGASGKIRIEKTIKNAIIVPQKSTFDVQDKTYMYIVDKDNRVKLRSITPKIRLTNHYILNPADLNQKEQFVYEGLQLIKDGDKINTKVIDLTKIIEQKEEIGENSK